MIEGDRARVRRKWCYLRREGDVVPNNAADPDFIQESREVFRCRISRLTGTKRPVAARRRGRIRGRPGQYTVDEDSCGVRGVSRDGDVVPHVESRLYTTALEVPAASRLRVRPRKLIRRTAAAVHIPAVDVDAHIL